MILTAKQENFCQAVFKGSNQADAFRTAYNASNWSANAIYVQASRLMGNPKLILRLQDLRDAAASSAIWDRAQVLKKAGRNVDAAFEKGNFAASNGALSIIVDVQGLKVTKVEHSGAIVHHLDGLSLQELETREQAVDALIAAKIVEGEVTQTIDVEAE